MRLRISVSVLCILQQIQYSMSSMDPQASIKFTPPSRDHRDSSIDTNFPSRPDENRDRAKQPLSSESRSDPVSQVVGDKSTLKENPLRYLYTSPARIITKMIDGVFKHFLSIFVSDPDILKSCVRVCSAIAWFYIILVCLGTAGVDTKPLLSILR